MKCMVISRNQPKLNFSPDMQTIETIQKTPRSKVMLTSTVGSCSKTILNIVATAVLNKRNLL